MVIRQESREQTVHRLRIFVNRFERRYERSSESMLKAVKDGEMKETAEIAKWLMRYRILKDLEEGGNGGLTTGSPTTAT